MKRLATAAALALLCAAASCTKIPERYSPEPPRIILESDEPIYRIKVNEPLKLTPTVENAGDDAAYRWSGAKNSPSPPKWITPKSPHSNGK